MVCFGPVYSRRQCGLCQGRSMYSPASSSLHACCERKKQVTCGITYTIWLLVASPTVRFRNSPPSSLIFPPLALTSILVVAARLCLEIPIYMVTPTMHNDTSVSMTVNCPKTEFFSLKKNRLKNVPPYAAITSESIMKFLNPEYLKLSTLPCNLTI